MNTTTLATKQLLLLTLLCCCVTAAACSAEGDGAGECSDGADNDTNGAFDCNDAGCAGSPDCTGDDDDAGDDDDGSPADDDTGADDDDISPDDDDTTPKGDDDTTSDDDDTTPKGDDDTESGDDDDTLAEDEDGDGYAVAEGDCDDDNAFVNPGATDVCENDIDEDCEDGDEPCPPGDSDADGFDEDEDCDDEDASVFPGAYESIDGQDNDCDGNTDYAGWNLITLWDFDADTATQVFDATATGNDADAGGASLVSGRCGDGRSLVTSQGDNIQSPWPAGFGTLAGSSPLSVAMWIQVTTSPSTLWAQMLCVQSDTAFPDTSGNLQHCLRLEVGRVPEWSTDDPSGYGDRLQAPGSPLSVGTWHHLAGVYSPSTGQKVLYLDGSPVATSTAFSSTSGDPVSVIALGGFDPWTPALDATVDEVMFFGGPLSALQVLTLAGSICP